MILLWSVNYMCRNLCKRLSNMILTKYKRKPELPNDLPTKVSGRILGVAVT